MITVKCKHCGNYASVTDRIAAIIHWFDCRVFNRWGKGIGR